MKNAGYEIEIELTPDVLDFFAHAVMRGKGGFQGLGRLLVDRTDRGTNPYLVLTREELARVVKYACVKGDGGFQSRLRKIVSLWLYQHCFEVLGVTLPPKEWQENQEIRGQGDNSHV